MKKKEKKPKTIDIEWDLSAFQPCIYADNMVIQETFDGVKVFFFESEYPFQINNLAKLTKITVKPVAKIFIPQAKLPQVVDAFQDILKKVGGEK